MRRNLPESKKGLNQKLLDYGTDPFSAIHQRILPLPGHVVKHNYTGGEMLRIARKGV
jgi:hypothetical protein